MVLIHIYIISTERANSPMKKGNCCDAWLYEMDGLSVEDYLIEEENEKIRKNNHDFGPHDFHLQIQKLRKLLFGKSLNNCS